MKINYLGVNYKCDINFSLHRPNGTDDYLFVLFKTPASVLENKHYSAVTPGAFILFEPHTVQSYYSCADVFNHDFIHFEFDNKSEEELLSKIPLNQLMHAKTPSMITEALQFVANEYLSNSENKNKSLSLLGQYFLLKVTDQINNNYLNAQTQRYYSTLLTLRTEILSNPQWKWTVNLMAKKMNLSSSYFQEIYKKTFGISCINDVIHARIKKAEQLLLFSNKNESEIADICGYENTEHFVRQFKKHCGQSPLRYRVLH